MMPYAPSVSPTINRGSRYFTNARAHMMGAEFESQFSNKNSRESTNYKEFMKMSSRLPQQLPKISSELCGRMSKDEDI